jgi:hypothetical protein
MPFPGISTLSEDQTISMLKECHYEGNKIVKFSGTPFMWSVLICANKLELINKGWVEDNYILTDKGIEKVLS